MYFPVCPNEMRKSTVSASQRNSDVIILIEQQAPILDCEHHPKTEPAFSHWHPPADLELLIGMIRAQEDGSAVPREN
jgi:hypothetical protein